ncbi:MAG: DUF421 domain-containing protein [Erysipelotrichales bacterium]|nr:DUF421 domain-containing protein [Erysipelotrichales bacterium]
MEVFLQTLGRAVLFYFLIAFIMRFLGKKEIAQLTILDFVIALMIADIAAVTIEDVNKSYWPIAFTLLTMMVMLRTISYFKMKSFPFRRILDGKRSVIVHKGRLRLNTMRKNTYTISDLIMQMRNNQINCISEISLAILEKNGQLSLFATPSEGMVALPVIISGSIISENLELLEINKEFVEQELIRLNTSLKKTPYASYKNKQLWIPEVVE